MNTQSDLPASDGANCSASSRKLLGYGLFCGVYWGKAAMKAWTLERGLMFATREEASAMHTSHCLSRETRQVYTTSVVNVGHHSHPDWVRADSLPNKSSVAIGRERPSAEA